MYNELSYRNTSGNTTHSPTLRGLVNSGADLLKQMYDVTIIFPDQMTDTAQDSNSAFNYPITVRCDGFTIPEVAVGTYDIKYHGISVKRPNGALEGERSFELTFREDAAFMLRQRFSLWLMAVADPVTGGVSNAVNYFGTVSVRTIAGEYTATQFIAPTGKALSGEGLSGNQIDNAKRGDQQDKQIVDMGNGALPEKKTQVDYRDTNPIAEWNFYHVWVSKVAGIEFSTEASEANKFAVQFQYQDCDMPFFGGNPIFDSADAQKNAGSGGSLATKNT
jgi:hypothetical protein